MIWLALSFLVTALLYSSVGFGGGSTYTALLVLADTDYRLVPVVSLSCNLVVVLGGTLSFWRAGLLKRDLALPLALASVPMAWLGGVTPVDREMFLALLGSALVASGFFLLLDSRLPVRQGAPIRQGLRMWIFGPVAGAGLGFLSGLVGIGGGIFLAPLLHLGRVDSAKVVAATASFFILVNSAAGLVGQWMKLGAQPIESGWASYSWLLLAVVVGGQIGNRAGISLLSARTIRRLTGVLVVFVGARILWIWLAGAL